LQGSANKLAYMLQKLVEWQVLSGGPTCHFFFDRLLEANVLHW